MRVTKVKVILHTSLQSKSSSEKLRRYTTFKLATELEGGKRSVSCRTSKQLNKTVGSDLLVAKTKTADRVTRSATGRTEGSQKQSSHA